MRRDPELHQRYIIADRLGKTVGEIMEMTEAEYAGWIAYLKITAQSTR